MSMPAPLFFPLLTSCESLRPHVVSFIFYSTILPCCYVYLKRGGRQAGLKFWFFLLFLPLTFFYFVEDQGLMRASRIGHGVSRAIGVWLVGGIGP
ncbi:hypothetical protein GE21DRAFT_1113602 [Neurospora crassa]|nr:hypothetical protein GE21DRAFT_1113602 [Neurospora crassa]